MLETILLIIGILIFAKHVEMEASNKKKIDELDPNCKEPKEVTGLYSLDSYFQEMNKMLKEQENDKNDNANQQDDIYYTETFEAKEEPNYYETSKWFNLRMSVIERDSFQCVNCGSRDSLQVHHLTYERFKKEQMEDLVTLCKTCHNLLHENVPKNSKFYPLSSIPSGSITP